MNYREKYKEHYKINFGSEFEVHHIDLNHQNDDIKNLLLLPRRLHHQYHSVLAKMPMTDGKLDLNVLIRGVADSGNGFNAYALSTLNDFVKVYSQCQDWKDFKSYLDGDIPNIHNIHIGGGEQ